MLAGWESNDHKTWKHSYHKGSEGTLPGASGRILCDQCLKVSRGGRTTGSSLRHTAVTSDVTLLDGKKSLCGSSGLYFFRGNGEGLQFTSPAR